MGEFSRSGAQMPTEQRRLAQAEHEQDLRRNLELKHHRDREPKRRSSWWRFWQRRASA